MHQRLDNDGWIARIEHRRFNSGDALELFCCFPLHDDCWIPDVRYIAHHKRVRAARTSGAARDA